MKILVPLLFIFFISLSGCHHTTNQSSAGTKNDSSLLVVRTEFHVSGMHCTGCENTIKTSVKELKGIASVDAFFKENKAVVAYDSTKTNEISIVAAIEDAGYKVDTFMRK